MYLYYTCKCTCVNIYTEVSDLCGTRLMAFLADMGHFSLIQLDTPVTEVVVGEKVFTHVHMHIKYPFTLIHYYINVSIGTFV
jgi:hypothetical protein